MPDVSEYQINELAKDNRSWRVDWFGSVTYAERYHRPSQPMIEVQFSCVPDDIPDFNGLFNLKKNDWPKTKQIRMPVGFLPMFKIGDIWRNGLHVESPEYDVEYFDELSVGRFDSTLIKSGLPSEENGHYFLPVSHHPYHIRHTQSYCVQIETTTCSLIIPSVELIRFYFGSSSTLVSTLFDAPFSADKLWIHTEDEDSRRSPKIHLAPDISGRSASDIGRIAFSRAARSAAELVGNSCITASANKESVYPKAMFPFEGNTDLKVSGKWLPFDGKERGVFLVFKILSCSHPFPFDTLRYTSTRKNSSASTGRASSAPGRENISKNRIFSKARQEIKSVVNDEPDKTKSPRTIRLHTGNTQFPDLVRKPVSRIESEAVPTILISKEGISIISGSSVGDAGRIASIQPIELSSDIDASLSTRGNHSAAYTLEVKIFFEIFRKIQEINPSVSVNIVRLDPRQRYDFLSTMPSIVDGDGEISPACHIPENVDRNKKTASSRNRRISIGCAAGIYSTIYFIIPEIKPTADGNNEIELHCLINTSKSIRTNSDLLAAISMHFLFNSDRCNTRKEIGPGTTGIVFRTIGSKDCTDALRLSEYLFSQALPFFEFRNTFENTSSHICDS
ncbi:MAG: hypothetical protein V4495_19945 [Pseudomonadota bacterium]